MKKVISKTTFKRLWYDPNTFRPNVIIFNCGESYYITNENNDMIVVNRCLFSKNIERGSDYIYHHFYTEKELRKIKLEKLNENRQ